MALFDRKPKEVPKTDSADGEIELLIKALGSKNWEKRGNAALKLTEMGQPALIYLFKALDSDNTLIQTGAAEVLGTFGEAALPTLLKIVFNGKERAKDGAARAVGQNGYNALPQLKEMLAGDNGADMKCGALLCLGYMGYLGDEIEAIILSYLRDKDPAVRKQAALSLDSINWKPKTNNAVSQYYIAKGDFEALSKVGAAAMPVIKAEVIEGSTETKQRIAEILPKIPGEDTLMVLLKLYGDADAQVRQKTILSMSECSDRRLVPYIVKGLEDEDSYVRMETGWALDRIGWKPSTPVEKARYFMVKERWVELLQMREAAIPILIQSLTDKNPGVRLKSTEVLRAMGNTGYAAINEALKSEDEAIRKGAQEAVAVIKKKNAAAAAAAAAGKKEEKKHADDDVEEQIRRQKEAQLAREGPGGNNLEKWIEIMRRNGLDEERIVRFSKALADDNEILRAAVVESLKTTGKCGIECMIALLGDKKDNVRIAAIESLGDLRAKQAVPYLLKIIRDKNNNIRAAVIHSLGQIHDPESLTYIIRMLIDTDPAVKKEVIAAAASYGTFAYDHLTSAFAAQDISIRCAAVEIVGMIDNPQSIGYCIRMLNDSEYDVRDCAENTLLKLSDRQFNPLIDYSFKISKRGNVREKTGLITVLSQLKDDRAKQAIGFFVEDPDNLVSGFAKETLKGETPAPLDLDALHAGAAKGAKKTAAKAKTAVKAKAKESSADAAAESGAETAESGEESEESEEDDESEVSTEELIAAVIKDLASKDNEVQMKAAEKIYTLGEDVIIPLLNAVTMSEDDSHRNFLAEILIGMGDVAIDGLIKCLKNDDPSIRITAAQSLGKIPDAKTIEALCDVLSTDNNTIVRRVAAESLGFIGGKMAFEVLAQSAEVGDLDLKNASLRSLGYIDDMRAIPVLIREIGARNQETAKITIEALSHYGADATAALEDALMTETGTTRERITYVLDELNWVPEREESMVCYLIARKQWKDIENIGENAIELLAKAAEDTQIDVKISAMNTIANIGGEKAVAVLEKIAAESSDPTAVTLATTMLTKARK